MGSRKYPMRTMRSLVSVVSSNCSGTTPNGHFLWELIMGEVKRHGVQQDDQTLLLLRVLT
jgi:hypothetical protein